MQIIHTPRTMTVRQYSRYEAEKDIRLLFRFRWLRFIPLRFVLKQLENFTTDFNRLFNPESGSDLYRQVDKLIFQNKLMIMQALSEAIHVHLVHKVRLDLTREKCGMKSKQSETLSNYIEMASNISGLEIKTLKDIEDFRHELERSVDKYEEMFAEKPKEGKTANIIELFYIYCSILEINPSYTDMTLYEFSELKKQAEEKSKRMQDQLKKK